MKNVLKKVRDSRNLKALIFMSLTLMFGTAQAASYDAKSAPTTEKQVAGMPVFSPEDAKESKGSWYDSWKNSGDVYDKYTWGLTGYVGIMTTNEMYHDMVFDFGSLGPGMLYSGEVNYQLDKNNWARKYLAPLLFASTIELNANVTYETDPTGPLWEFNPYFSFRWRDFPWNQSLLTTIGIGEGVSWASHNPQQELDSEDNDGDGSKFLNFLLFEVTFSLPEHPEWQVIYRLHHRSSVFGTYCEGTMGSTATGVAVRYWME